MAKSTKKETSEVLVGLWGLVDQAYHDKMIEEAFQLIPRKDQVRFIRSLLRNGQDISMRHMSDERERWDELKIRAEKLLEPCPLTEREHERNFYK